MRADKATGGPSVNIGTNPSGNNWTMLNIDNSNQLCLQMTPGNNVAIEWHSPGTLVGGTFTFHKISVLVTYGSNDNSTWTACSNTVVDTPYLITIAKQTCGATSVDSRVAYADADTVPANANKTGENLNFNGNIFKGGAFVGNMSVTNSQGDRSGTARVQIYPGLGQDGLDGYAMVIASMLHTGDPSYADGDLQVGVYIPDAGDTLLPSKPGAPTISQVAWNNKWTINPEFPFQSPPNYTKDPVSTTTLLGRTSTNQGSAIGDYASFVLTSVFDQSYTTSGGQTAYSTMALTPATAGQAICLASCNESAYASNNTSLFHWLMNSTFSPTGMSFPYTDATPRLWLITGNGVN